MIAAQEILQADIGHIAWTLPRACTLDRVTEAGHSLCAKLDYLVQLHATYCLLSVKWTMHSMRKLRMQSCSSHSRVDPVNLRCVEWRCDG